MLFENSDIRAAFEQALFALKLYADSDARDRERSVLTSLPNYLGIITVKDQIDLTFSELDCLSLEHKYSRGCVFELGESSLENYVNCLHYSRDDQDIAFWISRAAAALQFLHRNEFVHLDIKPANFVFVHEGPIVRLKLIDFECCRKIGDKIRKEG